MKPTLQTEHCDLYLADNAAVLPSLAGVDAVVTDPPYGIDYDPKVHRRYDGRDSRHDSITGDQAEMDLRFILEMPVPVIAWGAENYYRQLPHRGRWLCWHKRSYVTRPNSMPGGDFELAWFNATKGYYKYKQVIHGGCVNADSVHGNNEPRFHPTQKPVALMLWCLSLLPDADTILDPFAGSGTTAVACIRTGRRCVAIEKEPKYFDIMVRRVQEAEGVGSLFDPTRKPEVVDMFAEVS